MANNEGRTAHAPQPPAAGPLVVSEANPRYFTVASGNANRKAVYLTGSHIWNNLHVGMGPGKDCAETPEQLDFSAYLEFLKDHRPQATTSSGSGGGSALPQDVGGAGGCGSAQRVLSYNPARMGKDER